MKPILPRKASPKKNEATVVIETLTNAGDGLGRMGAQAVFVPGTMPGDTVRVKLVKQKTSWAQGRLITLVSPAAERIPPRCQHAGECGGCDWQHVPYDQQLDAKRSQFSEVMQRIGGFDNLLVPAVTPSEHQFQYRNRIQGEVRRGAFYFRARQQGTPVAIRRCEISEEPINAWLSRSVSSHPDGRFEVAIEDGEVVTHPMNDQRSTELGFRQVNVSMAQHLSSLIQAFVANSNSQRVFDLYCGRGDWAIDIATRHLGRDPGRDPGRDSGRDLGREVVGVDVSPDNIAIAKRRQQRSSALSRARLTFKVAKVEKVIKSLNLNDALCLVDPPRAGLQQTVTEALVKAGPSELMYVSCHPATLARDLKQLCQPAGSSAYEVTDIALLDMFPQTAHLESVVTLKRSSASRPDR